MKKVIYDEKGGMNIKILSELNKDKNFEKIYQDQIASNSIFYNSNEKFSIYLEVYAKENNAYLRIILFANEKDINKISKAFLDKMER